MDRSWMTEEEKSIPFVWAALTVLLMTPRDLWEIVDEINPDVLEGDDHSTDAEHRNRRPRNNQSLADDLAQRAQFAAWDIPFGKKAA